MTLILRSVKNDELEWSEVDGNFLYLENKIDDLAQLVNGDEVLRVTEQEFLPEQRAQARANLYAADVGTVQGIDERVGDIENLELVLYAEQSATEEQKQFLRNNADVYSKIEVQDAIAITTKNVTVSEEAQNVVPDANKNIVRFASLVTGTTIQPGINNGDQLLLINKSTAETPFNVNMPVVLQDTTEAAVFSVQPNTNYLFWFEQSINHWIDVTI